MRSIRIFKLAALAASLTAAAPALANPDAVTVSVGTSGLNLADAGDTARLRGRLARAATAACVEPGARGAASYAAFTACKREAMGAARLQMDRAIASATKRGGSALRAAKR